MSGSTTARPSASAARAMFDEARAAHPGVALDLDSFERHLAARAGEAADAIAGVRGGDLFLALACARGDGVALRIFDEQVLAPVASRLRSKTMQGAELLQAIRERLLVGEAGRAPRIAEYAGRGSLASWVRVSALRLLLNLERGERPMEELDESGTAAVAGLDPEMALLKARYREAMEQALQKGFAALEPHERTLLRQHFVDGLSIDRLAPLHGIHRATAARRLAATRGKLLAETVRELKETHAIAAHEVKSLLRLVRSELSLSLRTLMG